MSSNGIGINVRAITAFRTPYYHGTVPFIVSWSQKAGCTSILKWFLFHAGLYDEACQYVGNSPGLDIHSYEVKVLRASSEYKEGIARHLNQRKPVINFLRCPYQRAFSSYMHLNNRGYISQVRQGTISPGLVARKSLVEFVYGDGTSFEYPVSFSDYLEWVSAGCTGVADPHHMPQFSEIFHYSGIRHYRLEDFQLAIAMLEREYDLPPSQDARSAFSAGHHIKKEPVSRSSALKLLEKSIPLNPSELFRFPVVDRELLRGTRFDEMIREIFSRDLALYESLDPL